MAIAIRPARRDDAQAMCAVLNPIIAEGTTTAHRRPFNPDRMIAHYIAAPRSVGCMIASAGETIVGFQALEWPDPDWPHPDWPDPDCTDWGAVPQDWGLIASFVARAAQGRGVGQRLFTATLEAARASGMVAIDATIRADNAPGLAYYSRLGFVDYDRVAGVPLSDGTPVDRIRKVYALAKRD